MTAHSDNDLIRLETYTQHADAAHARVLLQSFGITGVVVVSKATLANSEKHRDHATFVYDLCVPQPDVAKAFHLMERESAILDLRRGSFHEEFSA